jgi:hypothetical protein
VSNRASMSVGLHRNRDRITDLGASALASGCSQLQLIDLRDCCEITDIRHRCISIGGAWMRSVAVD